MPHYQIEFKSLSQSFYIYFQADDNVGDRACEIAEKEIAHRKIEPIEKLMVREFNEKSRMVISKGHRFPLHLRRARAILSTGEIIQEQYYQALYR